jgi:hypothetical protein
MRKLLNRKVVEQGGKCAICHEEFTDYNDVVPDHRDPKGMGGAWRDDHPDNIQAAHALFLLVSLVELRYRLPRHLESYQ